MDEKNKRKTTTLKVEFPVLDAVDGPTVGADGKPREEYKDKDLK